jgi:pimeloyl-ACP methyl ester carboxylesterase
VTLLVVPGRGVPAAQYSWLLDPQLLGTGRGSVLDGLYSGLHDDRGGPRAYAAVQSTLEQIQVDGGPPPLVVGHSTGARAALRMLVEVPDLVAGVVALSVIGDLADHVRRAAPLLPDYAAAVTRDLGQLDVAADAYRDRSPVTWEWSTGQRRPVLLISGELDRVCPPQEARRLYARLTSDGWNAHLVVLPGCGHFFECFGFDGDRRAEVLAAIADRHSFQAP